MASRLKEGLVQIYTGTGKGKTTAAFGLALRAAGSGLKVYIQQFIKGMPYGENAAFRKIGNVRIEQCGRGCFIKGNPKPEDVECARKGLEKARRVIESGVCDIVIMDEVNIAVAIGLIKSSEIIAIIKNKPRTVELVLTGRGCPRSLYAHADLVTEMKSIKHPYDKGVAGRKGIEH
jgi:cob(I)alamin adenosyltransferase